MRVHWLQHAPFEGLGNIEAWLQARSAVVTRTRLFAGEALPDLHGLDLVVVMGGPMSVNDEERFPWLTAELAFVRAAIQREIAVLGICLGAQLIARAMGARVYANGQPEIGWWPITGLSGAADVPGWARQGAVSPVFHWHGETFDLPAGAEPLARSAACEHQAFRLGRRVVGLQFHLETTPELVDGMAGACGDELIPAAFVQPEAALRAGAAGEQTALAALMADTLETLVLPAASAAAAAPHADAAR